MKETLLKLGLTENEIQAYLNLLKEGNRTAAEVARSLSLDKSSTYRACENLTKTGLLISSPQKRGTTYLAQSPEILQSLYEQRLKQYTNLGKDLNDLIKELKSDSNSSARNVYIRTEFGIEAIREVMNESLNNKGKVIREWQQNGKRSYHDPAQVNFILDFVKRRVKAGITIKQLESNENFIDTDFNNIMSTDKSILKEIHMVTGKYSDRNTLRIWDDTVNIISSDDKDNFVVVTIKDKFISGLIQNLFDFIWSNSDIYINPSRVSKTS